MNTYPVGTRCGTPPALCTLLINTREMGRSSHEHLSSVDLLRYTTCTLHA